MVIGTIFNLRNYHYGHTISNSIRALTFKCRISWLYRLWISEGKIAVHFPLKYDFSWLFKYSAPFLSKGVYFKCNFIFTFLLCFGMDLVTEEKKRHRNSCSDESNFTLLSKKIWKGLCFHDIWYINCRIVFLVALLSVFLFPWRVRLYLNSWSAMFLVWRPPLWNRITGLKCVLLHP